MRSRSWTATIRSIQRTRGGSRGPARGWTRRSRGGPHDDESTHDDAASRSAGRCGRVLRDLACRRRFAGRAERQLPGPHRLARRVLPGGHRERAGHVVLRRFDVGRGDLARRSSNRVGDGARGRRAGARVRRDRLRGRPRPDLGRRRRAAAQRERRRPRLRRIERGAARDVSAARSWAAERCRGHARRGLRHRLQLPAAGRDPLGTGRRAPAALGGEDPAGRRRLSPDPRLQPERDRGRERRPARGAVLDGQALPGRPGHRRRRRVRPRRSQPRLSRTGSSCSGTRSTWSARSRTGSPWSRSQRG